MQSPCSLPLFARPLALALLMLATLPLLRSASQESRAVANLEPIELPPFVVEAERTDFGNWSKTVSQHFIIYTDQGAKEGQETIRNLELLREAGIRLFGLTLLRSERMIFILPSRHSDWTKLELMVRRGMEWRPAASRILASPVRVYLVKSLSGISQFFSRNDEGYYFYTMFGIDLLRSAGLPSVIWYDRGVGHLMGDSRVSENEVELGRGSIKERVALRSKGFIPWNRFFLVDASSPEFLKKDEIRRYDAQCSLFIRFLLTHPDPSWKAKLDEWMDYLASRKPPSEEAFARIFGQNYAQWQETMRQFLGKREKHVIEYVFKPGEVDTRASSDDLKPTEMRELFMLAQISTQRRSEMAPLLDRMLKKGLKSEPLRLVLAAACVRHERFDGAYDTLRPLLSGGPQIPQVYEEAAHALYRQLPGPVSLDTVVRPEDREIGELARKALDLEPRLATSKTVLAFTLALQAKPAPEDLTCISDLVSQAGKHPIRADLLLALALAQARTGRAIEAHDTCEQIEEETGGKYSSTPLFKSLKTMLESETAP